MSAPSSPGIRIGNDERAAAMKALDEHMSAGRLDPDEYGQRVAQASIARTREGLEELFTDLPEPHPFPSAATPRRRAEGVLQRLAGQSAILRLAVLVIAGMLFLAVLPFVAAGALLVFVVLPLLGRGVCGPRVWRGGRRGWRW